MNFKKINKDKIKTEIFNLRSKEKRREFKIMQSGKEINSGVTFLVLLVAVLPLIPEANKQDYTLPTFIKVIKYSHALSLFILLIILLIIYNMVLIINHLNKKYKLKKITKEIIFLKKIEQIV